MKSRRPQGRSLSGQQFRRENQRRSSPFEASMEMGSVVYFIRCRDGCVKIGFTTDIANRRCKLAVRWDAILAVVPGGRELEYELHTKFEHLLAYGEEYFSPKPELIDYVNELRGRMGVSPVAHWHRLVLPPLVQLDERALDPSS